MDGSVSAHGNDPFVALFTGLPGQLGGMCGIDRSTPIGITVFIDDGAQIVGDFPGVAHVGHRVQDDHDFAGHAVLLVQKF